MVDEADDSAPGWDAIDAACARIYGTAEPQHWGTVVKYMLGGQDPLDGVSAFDAGDHWHYVSYGYSDLYTKEEGADPEWSGFGMEMTFRLKKQGAEAPVWPVGLLQNLARYVFGSGNLLMPGHTMPANGPIAADEDTELHALVFTEDPQLGEIETPHGKITFVQCVGITNAERQFSSSWNSAGLLELLRQDSKMLVSDLARPDRSQDPEWQRRAKEGRARDGSSMGKLFAPDLEWCIKGLLRKRAQVRLGALALGNFAEVLPGRVPFDRPLGIDGENQALLFEPAQACSWSRDGDTLRIGLTAEAAQELATTLRPSRGDYAIDALPGIEFTVTPSEVKDEHGNVSHVVG